MKKPFFILLTLVIALTASPTFAQQSTLPQIDPKWIQCSANEDCTSIGAECGNPMGVNVQYLDLYRKAAADMLRAQCSQSSGEVAALAKNTITYCRNNSCYAFIPNTLTDPNWYYCKTDADCTLAQGICGLSQAVATVHVKDFANMVNRIRTHQQPACQGATQDMESKIQAMHNVCRGNQCSLVP